MCHIIACFPFFVLFPLFALRSSASRTTHTSSSCLPKSFHSGRAPKLNLAWLAFCFALNVLWKLYVCVCLCHRVIDILWIVLRVHFVNGTSSSTHHIIQPPFDGSIVPDKLSPRGLGVRSLSLAKSQLKPQDMKRFPALNATNKRSRTLSHTHTLEIHDLYILFVIYTSVKWIRI